MLHLSHSLRAVLSRTGRGALVLGIALVLFATCIVASAQLAGKGGLNGRVVDSSGGLIPNAVVTITNVDTNGKQITRATSSGDYSFSLDPGKYRLAISAEGFKEFIQDNILVDALQTFSIDAVLQVGSSNETVTVTTASPLLESSNASLGATIEQAQYSALPLIEDGGGQRRATDFAQLMPGVNGQVTNGGAGTNAGMVNGSGSKGAVSSIYINGIPLGSVAGAGDPRFVWTSMAVDAISQFQVQTTGYSALYEGQGVQNYIVKNGTNVLHGDLYDYYRDQGLDTWGFLKANNPATGLPQKPNEHQHEFGMFLGFPIIKDKLFVFGGYEGYRFRRQVPFAYETIPTLKMRTGDFSELGNNIYDPDTTTFTPKVGTTAAYYSRQQFSGNMIPLSRQSQVARNMQAFLPAPSNSSTINNYLVNYVTGLSNWTTTNRIDYTINSKQTLSAVLAWGRQSTTAPAAVSISTSSNGMPPPYISSQQFFPKTKVLEFEYTYAITSHITNQLKYAYGRYDSTGLNQDIGNAFAASTLGFTGLPVGQTQTSFPTVTFSGNSNINRWAGYSSNRNIATGYAAIDNLQWNTGRHQFTFGTQITWMQYNFLNNATGVNPLQLTFSNSLTQGYSGSTTAVTTTGQAYASFLIGAASNGSFTLSAVPETGARFRPTSGYIQDNWKALRNLTLDLGVRYDYYTSYEEAKDRFSYFDPNATNPLTGTPGALAFGGYGTGRCNCRTPVNNYALGFSPRVGFAWQIDPKTVVRGSYGIMYAHGDANGGSASSRQGPSLTGYSTSPSTTTSNPSVAGVTGSSYYKIDTSYPSYTAPPTLDPTLGTYYTTLSSQPSQTLAYADPFYGGRASQFVNWSFGFQHQLDSATVMTMSYVGSMGHFLQPDSTNGRGYWLNQLDPKWLYLGTQLSNPANATNLAAAGLPTTLPYASFGGVGNPSIQQFLKPFPQYAGLSDPYGFVGNTQFHALQVYATRRLSSGLTFMTNYTWSKSLDNDATFRSGYDIPASVATDGQFHSARSLDKSLSAADQRHKFVFTGVYKLPFGTGHLGGDHYLTRALFSDFSLSSVYIAYSGPPLSVTMNSANTNPSQSVAYPVRNPAYYGDGTLGAGRPHTQAEVSSKQFLDRNAFVATPNYQISTLARTAGYIGLFQPGNYRLDMSLRRTFQVPMGSFHEGTTFTVEADGFNMTNHTHFVYSLSNAVLNQWTATSTSYGQMSPDTNVQTNRAVQLAARLTF
jgi:hypothetical protein